MSRTYRATGDRAYNKVSPKYADYDWYKEYMSKFHRDGYLHDSGHKSYKKYSDTLRRKIDRDFEYHALNDNEEDFDDRAYPSEKQTKYLAWVVW